MASSTTPTINLILPDTTENYSISVANTNAQAIDAAVADLQADIDDVSDIIDDTVRGASTTYSSEYIATRLTNISSAAQSAQTAASAAQSDIDELTDDVLDGSAIGNGAITTGKIDASAVTTGKIANSAVTTEKIANRAVTLDKVSANLATVYSYAKSAAEYTGAPMQIGTWYNGVPIWRLMFQHELTAQEQSNKAYDPISDVVRYAGGTYDSFIVNAFATINFADTPTVADSTSVRFGGGTYFEWDNAPPDPAIYGFVDFVTPIENIID